MLKKHQGRGLLSRFTNNKEGNLTVTFALSLTLVVIGVGAATDFSALSAAHSKAQSVADSTALAAAVYIRDNDRPPTNEADGYLDGVTYTAAELGLSFNNSVEGGDEGVTIRVDYDDNAKETVVTVQGATNPSFTSVFGKDRLPFSSRSVVSYLDIDNKFPASITLVLDNSGSMQFDDKPALNVHSFRHFYSCFRNNRWRTCFYDHNHGERPPGATIRLDGLKNSVETFQADLSDRLGVEDDSSRRTIRMGMLPYSSDIIADGTVEMDWGYLPVGTDGGTVGIRGMRADGGTNSSPPMSTAQEWLENEDAFHTSEAERTGSEDKDPLKFAIFMTDGQNTVGNREIVPGNTGKWYRETSPGNFSQSGSALPGYTEGSLFLLTDQETLEACTAMKADGVTIFTIGYALEESGDFLVNGWGNYEPERTIFISDTVQSAAYSLIQDCASSPDHFITAADAGSLESAFDEIQNAIVEELIRIKS